MARGCSPPSAVETGCTHADHEALKANLTSWRQLAPGGYWTNPVDGITYEQRTCRCGSSLNKPGEVVVFRYLDETPPTPPQMAQAPASVMRPQLQRAA
jgi:hypothetical protein